MPQGDRTGPVGAGSRTGRGLGYCAGMDTPGYANPGFGFGGFGRGRGWRRGFGLRHRFFAAAPIGWGYPSYTPPTREETLSELKANAEWLNGQLDIVNKRIEELKE
jgi:hypothetical protein